MESNNSGLEHIAKLSRIKAVMLGHAVGDALGVPVEFMSREELEENPVVDMRGFGTYPFPAGTWSDDTSISLCALESLAKGGYDPDDVMQNFGRWYYDEEFTASGDTFDIGSTCRYAIESYFTYKQGCDSCGQNGELSNGNGSLMRIHPFVLYLSGRNTAFADKLNIIYSASALTHAHMRSKLGCGIYACVLWELLLKPCRESIYRGLSQAQTALSAFNEFSEYQRIFKEDFSALNSDDIGSSGYVVDTLEAALWCLLTTKSYRECVLKAVNLGGDTDTVAAVAGGLAGALYGLDAIPDEWINTLLRHSYIEDMCERAFTAWSTEENGIPV